MRTDDVLAAYRPEILDSYRAVYDGTYEWALFMELDYGRRLTCVDREWRDLVTHHQMRDPAHLKTTGRRGTSLSGPDPPQAFYNPLYCKYEKRFQRPSVKVISGEDCTRDFRAGMWSCSHPDRHEKPNAF